MSRVQAVLFDLDGTLMDSEVLTDRAIARAMAECGVGDATLPPAETRGRTWGDIARALLLRYPHAKWGTGGFPVAADLAERMAALWVTAADDVRPIPGAAQAVVDAAALLRVAIVSSSPRAVIDLFLYRLGVASLFPEHARVGAEDVAHGKPHPEPYLRAAGRLGIDPADCLVFEDAVAGLQSARAAGMGTVAVLHACALPEECRAISDRAIRDYRVLPRDVWPLLVRDGLAALSEERT